jgi:preprotein translocase SecE subunit
MKNLINFLHGVRVEFSKVVWPKWNEFIGSTIIVLFLVVVFALYLAALDYGFKKIIFEGITHYIYKMYGR